MLAPQADLAAFLAEHQVEVIASLPYWAEQQTDAQRGSGVFRKSLDAIRKLNELGYGHPGSGLTLNFVYNPVGAFLPPSQAAIEADFRRELQRRYAVVFNSLYTITNMPISRYLEFLLRSGNYEQYMERLANAFNPAAAAAVMCRTMISVGWDGRLYDCDFNQMLDLPIEASGQTQNIRQFNLTALESRSIVVGSHCFGCTAGQGSSCGGTTS
jgi:radical SAM/Cys-rich protein